MNKKRVWRYYCEFCGKGGCSASHMKHHEAHCTMNPDRKCGFCDTVDMPQRPIVELLKALKADIIEFKKTNDFNKEEECVLSGLVFSSEYNVLLDALGGACEFCPACMLATLRQSKMIHHIRFDFKDEKGKFWSDYNEEQREDEEIELFNDM